MKAHIKATFSVVAVVAILIGLILGLYYIPFKIACAFGITIVCGALNHLYSAFYEFYKND